MGNFAKLIYTNTYYNTFDLLCENLSKRKGENTNTLVFCEEKISLMAERHICAKLGGSLNIRVFSFKKFLKEHKKINNLLSKEGSSMAVKKILSNIDLKCFRQSTLNLAPSLYNLIILLKSAKISPKDVLADQVSDAILKNKLLDISSIFSEYEKFVLQNGFCDQSSILNYLPPLIEQLDLSNTEVYLLGYTGWTRQARDIISALLKMAKSVTAILTAGKNNQVYLNETANAFIDLCKDNKIELSSEYKPSNLNSESEHLLCNLFKPNVFNKQKIVTDKIKLNCYPSPVEEVKNVAKIIKKEVISNGARYKDFVIAVSDLNTYSSILERELKLLDVKYFIDQKRKVDNHPIVSLIVAYIDTVRRGYDKKDFKYFYKNPLISQDKAFLDGFEKYVNKYNVNYKRFFSPFTFCDGDEERFNEYENFRKKICSLFSEFSVSTLLEKLNVKDNIESLNEKLVKMGQVELAEVSSQVYEQVIKILQEMDLILGDSKISLLEYKKIFTSGVNAMELSIIPQYSDAVFIGDYRECALTKAKNLFMIGLNDSVPLLKEDVALLNDNDINKLEKVKILVEPKIRIVNGRAKENLALACASFSENLYLSYSAFSDEGKQLAKSQLLTYFESMFTLSGVEKEGEYDAYLSKNQAINSFSKDVGDFADGKIDDFTIANSFYALNKDSWLLLDILKYANKEVKIRLEGDKKSVISRVVSPTTIEDFYRCPYRAFASHTLKIKEKDSGSVDALVVGNFIHSVLENYVKRIEEIDGESASNKVFDECLEDIIKSDDYKRFKIDAGTDFAFKQATKEAKEFCYKTYLQFTSTDFKPFKNEATFGVGEVGVDCDFEAIKLTDNVKLTGKIDRIDTYKGYYRIIDYKTGKVSDKDSDLYAGIKLQLYLYAQAVKNLTLAGAYYVPISNAYIKEGDKKPCYAVGKTLQDKGVVFAHDKNIEINGYGEFIDVTYADEKIKNAVDSKTFSAYTDYAFKISKLGAQQMTEGVIVASPLEKQCDFCKLKGLCGVNKEFIRKIGKISAKNIVSAVEEE